MVLNVNNQKRQSVNFTSWDSGNRKNFNLLLMALVKHQPSTQQLKDEDSQRPVVGRQVVSFIQDDLRGHVLWSPTKRPRLLPQAKFFSKTKVHLENSDCSLPFEYFVGKYTKMQTYLTMFLIFLEFLRRMLTIFVG